PQRLNRSQVWSAQVRGPEHCSTRIRTVPFPPPSPHVQWIGPRTCADQNTSVRQPILAGLRPKSNPHIPSGARAVLISRPPVVEAGDGGPQVTTERVFGAGVLLADRLAPLLPAVKKAAD